MKLPDWQAFRKVPSLVSLAGNTFVAPEKYAAVMAVVERMNYKPNMAAQGLVNGRTSAVGILTRALGSPFYGEMLRGIAVGLQGSDYSPVIGMGSEIPNEDLNAVNFLLSRRVDALILLYSNTLTDEYIREIAAENPTGCHRALGAGFGKNSVCTCTILQVRILQPLTSSHKGHQGIAHITGSMDTPDAIDRKAGYVQALIDHQIEPDPALIIEGDFAETSGPLAVDKLISIREAHPFSAIFAANDQTAMGVRLALYHRQIDVPNDISLVGYDDLSSSQYMTPPLTTVRQPVYYMGLMAAKAVQAAMVGKEFALPEFPGELVVRQSVSIAGRKP